MKLLNSIFIGLALLLIVSCGESPEDYNKRAFALADSLVLRADLNFDVISDCHSSWRSVIFDHTYISPIFHIESYCSDINEGLEHYRKDLLPLDSLFKSRKALDDSLFKTIKDYPDKSKSVYENIRELYSINTMSYDMMLKPSGSLESFTKNFNDLYSKYKEIKTKIEIEKK